MMTGDGGTSFLVGIFFGTLFDGKGCDGNGERICIEGINDWCSLV